MKRALPLLPALALASLLAAGMAAIAAPARALPLVTAKIDPPVSTVGDRVEVILTLSRTGNLPSPPHFPTWPKRWGKAEVVETGKVETGSDPEGPTYRQRLVLSAFETGRLELPPTAIRVPTASGDVPVYTPSNLALDVRSVLPPAAKDSKKEPEPKPAVPPKALPIGKAVWVTLGALALACAAALWIERRRRRARGEAMADRPFLPPVEELLGALSGDGEGLHPVEAHTRLSYAVRRYLGRRLPFPALESTTSEIQRQLVSRRLPSGLTARAVELLRACDWVKFARRPPTTGETAGETARRFGAARELARELEVHFAPPAPVPVATTPPAPAVTARRAAR